MCSGLCGREAIHPEYLGSAGHGSGRADSGHEVTDLSGQLGLGFGRWLWWVLAEGCGFRNAGLFVLTQHLDLHHVGHPDGKLPLDYIDGIPPVVGS